MKEHTMLLAMLCVIVLCWQPIAGAADVNPAPDSELEGAGSVQEMMMLLCDVSQEQHEQNMESRSAEIRQMIEAMAEANRSRQPAEQAALDTLQTEALDIANLSVMQNLESVTPGTNRGQTSMLDGAQGTNLEAMGITNQTSMQGLGHPQADSDGMGLGYFQISEIMTQLALEQEQLDRQRQLLEQYSADEAQRIAEMIQRRHDSWDIAHNMLQAQSEAMRAIIKNL